ncbi:hypothetical protein [Methylomonas koyamae]|uniref:hypothetical protein n=1 Tax=Methylomonas koyamae TaxID=702114 RepID=UPI0011285259|nr:hypothetical protein [Methylomonas koyamae]TPQ24912.1 hypothetical protein C2U68_17190 [Methylomonas koyamae]
MQQPTLYETLDEFDAGLFAKKTHEQLKDVALAVIRGDGKKKGKVTIEIELDKIGDSSSVTVAHTLKVSKPTKRGKATEEDTTSTPMYVDNFGYLTIAPQTQEDLFRQENPGDNVAQFGRSK